MSETEEWFWQIGFRGSEADYDYVLDAIEARCEFVYGGGTRDDDRQVKGYPVELEAAERKVERAREALAVLAEDTNPQSDERRAV